MVVVLLVTIPFLNKAFDWDDREFIEFAKVFSEHPLQQHLADLEYKGLFYEEFRTTHPPLLSYYLSLFLRLGFSVSEVLFRSAYIVFPLIAAVSMYALGRRFTGSAFLASLLLIVTPGFMVISHTLMGDFPGLAMWLASGASFLWGVDRSDGRLLALSGLVMSLAVLISYQALSVIPLLLFYILINKRFRVWNFLVLAAPLVAFGVYSLLIHLGYDELPMFSYQAGLGFGFQDFELKARAFLTFIGAGAIFPLAVIILFMRKKIDFLIGFLLIPPLLTWACIYYLGEENLSLYLAILLAFSVAAGFLIFYKFFHCAIAEFVARKKYKAWRDTWFITAWAIGVAAYTLVFLPFVTMRFLLPLFPPAIILFVREAENFLPMRQRLRAMFVIISIALTFTAGLVATLADYRLADTYRDVAEELGREYGGSEGQLWVLSEFGMRYYMQQQGFRYLGPRTALEADRGDIVVTSAVNGYGVVGDLPEGSYRILETIEPEDGYPVRTMNPWAGAGFYGHLMGPMPYLVSGEKLDEITVYILDWKETGNASNR